MFNVSPTKLAITSVMYLFSPSLVLYERVCKRPFTKQGLPFRKFPTLSPSFPHATQLIKAVCSFVSSVALSIYVLVQASVNVATVLITFLLPF